MDWPCDATALRGFIGAVNFYKDLCPSRAHVLKPLTHTTEYYRNKVGTMYHAAELEDLSWYIM